MGSAASVQTKPQFQGWLPQTYQTLEAWITTKTVEVEKGEDKPFHPVIQEFQQLIEGDAEIFMGFHQMFDQVPRRAPYNKDPTGKPQVRPFSIMLSFQTQLFSNRSEITSRCLSFSIASSLRYVPQYTVK